MHVWDGRKDLKSKIDHNHEHHFIQRIAINNKLK